MADKAWKKFERDAALLFNGARYWANSGERSDFEGEVPTPFWYGFPGAFPQGVAYWNKIKGQCKLTKTLSLAALTRLAEEPGVDVVCVKLRRGSGRASSGLVVMTFETYARLFKIGQEKDPKAAASAIREQRPKVPYMRKGNVSS